MQDSSFTAVLKRAIASTTTGVVIADYLQKDQPLIYINPVFEAMTGYTVDECMGTNCRFLQGPNTDPKQVKIIREAIANGKECKVILLNYRKDGSTFWNELSLSPVKDEVGKLTHYVGIQDDISEKIEIDRKLQEALEAAQEASKLKTEFLNIISHELRTPLTVMLGNLPLLKDPKDLPEADEIAEIAEDIEDSGLHLLELINELLDISRIEEGRMKFDMDSLSMKSCIEVALHHVDKMMERKNLTFHSEIEDFQFMGDSMRLKQILINLLGNAIKFTDKGTITIKSFTEGIEGVIEVHDTGCGIDPDFIPHVFDVFRMADGKATRQRSGSGLGLAITKKLVLAHSGNISVESVVNEGSVFSIRFPLIAK